MLPALLNAANHPARRGLFWTALAALVVAQLAALWMLCSHQVRAAEVRHAGLRGEQMALVDCLHSAPGATLASCTGAMTDAGADAQR